MNTEKMAKYGFSGVEPSTIFAYKLAEILHGFEARIAELEAQLASKPEPKKAAVKKSAE